MFSKYLFLVSPKLWLILIFLLCLLCATVQRKNLFVRSHLLVILGLYLLYKCSLRRFEQRDSKFRVCRVPSVHFGSLHREQSYQNFVSLGNNYAPKFQIHSLQICVSTNANCFFPKSTVDDFMYLPLWHWTAQLAWFGFLFLFLCLFYFCFSTTTLHYFTIFLFISVWIKRRNRCLLGITSP